MALIPPPGGRGRQISEFEASLVYGMSSRTARANTEKPYLKKQKQNNYNKTQTNHSQNKALKSPCG